MQLTELKIKEFAREGAYAGSQRVLNVLKQLQGQGQGLQFTGLWY